jgi:hypothetical protein
MEYPIGLRRQATWRNSSAKMRKIKMLAEKSCKSGKAPSFGDYF